MRAVMRNRGFRLAVLLLCTGLLPPANLHAGSGIWLYPLARAFGSPSEAELARCREAFRQFQTRDPNCVILVEPMLHAVLTREGADQYYDQGLSERLIKRLTPRLAARLSQAPDKPAVPDAKLGHNQLRYTWERAALYAECTAKAHCQADYVLFTEVWVAGPNVIALQVYLVNAAGQITYCRLYNSHQFGDQLKFHSQNWLKFLIQHTLRDFQREPEDIFPKYGVG